jgi:hypothetical protein
MLPESASRATIRETLACGSSWQDAGLDVAKPSYEISLKEKILCSIEWRADFRAKLFANVRKGAD